MGKAVVQVVENLKMERDKNVRNICVVGIEMVLYVVCLWFVSVKQK